MKNKEKQSNNSCKYNGQFKKADERIENNQFDKALDMLNKIQHDCLEYNVSLFMKSRVLSSQDDMENSKKAFYCGNGVCYRNNQFDEAIKCFDEAIKLNPMDMHLIICKAAVYSELMDYEKADELFKIAEDIDDRDTLFLIEKGKHLLNQNKFQEAINYFNRFLEIDDEQALVWMYKSMALSEIGHDEESEFCFKTAIDLDPDSINVFDEVLVIED